MYNLLQKVFISLKQLLWEIKTCYLKLPVKTDLINKGFNETLDKIYYLFLKSIAPASQSH